MIIFSVLAILISAVVMWWAFLREEPVYVPPSVALPEAREIAINFEVLERVRDFSAFVEIQPFVEIIPTGEEEEEAEEMRIGRQNPFIPYY